MHLNLVFIGLAAQAPGRDLSVFNLANALPSLLGPPLT
jgi:hypothetical protein